MNNLVQFSFGNNNISTVTDGSNNVWFVAKDVAEALGYVNTAQAIRAHCKKSTPVETIARYESWVTKDTTQENLQLSDSCKIHGSSLLIPESDLFRLIFGSELESALAFQDWVFEEVLPSIRKTGKYAPTREQLKLELLEESIANVKALAESGEANVIKAVRAARDSGANVDIFSKEIKDKLERVSTRVLARMMQKKRKEETMDGYLERAGLQTAKHQLTDKGREFGEVVYQAVSYDISKPLNTLWFPEVLNYIRSHPSNY